MSGSSLSAHGGGRKVHFVVSVFSHSQRERRCVALRMLIGVALCVSLPPRAYNLFWIKCIMLHTHFGLHIWHSKRSLAASVARSLSLRSQVDCQIICRSNKRFRVECEQFFPARLPHVSDSFVIETAVSRTVLVCCFVILIRYVFLFSSVFSIVLSRFFTLFNRSAFFYIFLGAGRRQVVVVACLSHKRCTLAHTLPVVVAITLDKM